MATSGRLGAILQGEARAAASLMRDLEDNVEGTEDELARLLAGAYRQSSSASVSLPRPHIIGITGGPGSGKSTLVDRLIGEYRKRCEFVGVVAVDPSSPFSGGALLGDRIRMQRHTSDPGVFVRSLSNRGHLGGLSLRSAEVAAVLGVLLGTAGRTTVIIETVGVGQSELEVAQVADTVVVVAVPGLGDEVQALKSGILEIADVLVLNKCDRAGADHTETHLQTMLSLRPPEAPPIPLVRTTATTGEGTAALVDVLLSTYSALQADRPRHVFRTRKQLGALVISRWQERFYAKMAGRLGGERAADELSDELSRLAVAVLDGKMEMFEAVAELDSALA